MIFNIISEDDNLKKQGIVEIAGIHTLLSRTLVTAIDRTLLSSIPSYAPTSYRLNNLTNYQDCDSFREKFLELRSNIEAIRLIANDEVYLEYKGYVTGQLLLRDLTPISKSDVCYINPNLVILTSCSEEPIEVDLYIKFEKGVYFRTTEQYELERNYQEAVNQIHQQQNITDNSIIPCNAIFNPVIKCKSHIQNDGEVNERIIYEIQTDGRVSYLDALKRAVNLLMNEINSLQECMSSSFTTQTMPVVEVGTDIFNKGETSTESLKNIRTLEELNLTPQQYNFMKIAYKGVKDLKKDIEFNQLKNIYRLFNNNNVAYNVEELKERLSVLGIKMEEM